MIPEFSRVSTDFVKLSSRFVNTAANFLLATFILILCLPPIARPADGDLDSSFGNNNGFVATKIGAGDDGARALAIQSDGKIVVAGNNQIDGGFDIAVVRYNTNGSLDTSFGNNNGVVITKIGGSDDEAYGVAIQADGKIVVAGLAQFVGRFFIAVVRYNTNGTLDTSFGNNNGFVTTRIGESDDEAYGVAIQSDGKIVVAGRAQIAQNNGSAFEIAVVRYNTNGSLDTSFGNNNGFVATKIGAGDDGARALAIQSDGKIVVAGNNQIDGGFDIAVVRYNTNGSLDTSFGNNNGVVITKIGGSDDEAYGVAIQADGKIVVAGLAQFVGRFFIAVVRYNTNGTLDTSFGNNNGFVTTRIGGSDDEAYAVAIQGDGKIVVTGRSEIVGTFDIVLVRYNTDGSLDTSFGNGGEVTTKVGQSDDEARALAIQTDGNIAVAGRSELDGFFNIIVARYVDPSSSSIGTSSVSGSGGCGMTRGTGNDDPTLMGIVGLALIFLFRKYLKRRPINNLVPDPNQVVT